MPQPSTTAQGQAAPQPPPQHRAHAPQPRTAAQRAAARLNGSRSRGPVTPEGKARSSQNALKHGLRAAHHLILPDEDGTAYAGLLAALLAEHQPASKLEQDLTRQLAATLWKQDRADRLAAEQLAAAPAYGHELPAAAPESQQTSLGSAPTQGPPSPPPDHAPGRAPAPDRLPLLRAGYAAHHARLEILRCHHARLGCEQSRVLRELHRLRREALIANVANEPAAPVSPNEPGRLARQAALPAKEPGAVGTVANGPGRIAWPALPANEPGLGPLASASPLAHRPPMAGLVPGHRHATAGLKGGLRDVRAGAATMLANEPGPPVSRQQRRWLERQARKAARRRR